jgi:hypothetical protein
MVQRQVALKAAIVDRVVNRHGSVDFSLMQHRASPPALRNDLTIPCKMQKESLRHCSSRPNGYSLSVKHDG